MKWQWRKTARCRLAAWTALGALALGAGAALSLANTACQWRRARSEYLTGQAYAIPVEASDAVLGPRDGRLHLVVFASLECPWCRVFADTVRQLHRRFPDHLTIVFKHFPLGAACNSLLTSDMQPGACAAAWGAEAAKLQGGFWRYHDELLRRSPAGTSADTLVRAAGGAALDVNRWLQDTQTPVVRQLVSRDVELGRRLGVRGTPAVFLDGRRVANPTLSMLARLIAERVATEGE